MQLVVLSDHAGERLAAARERREPAVRQADERHQKELHRHRIWVAEAAEFRDRALAERRLLHRVANPPAADPEALRVRGQGRAWRRVASDPFGPLDRALAERQHPKRRVSRRPNRARRRGLLPTFPLPALLSLADIAERAVAE
ncbi:MAG: hypothetical protein ABSF03_33465 [Streptosporangiaceae bacterium]|jgi:hypothetical protein